MMVRRCESTSIRDPGNCKIPSSQTRLEGKHIKARLDKRSVARLVQCHSVKRAHVTKKYSRFKATKKKFFVLIFKKVRLRSRYLVFTNLLFGLLYNLFLETQKIRYFFVTFLPLESFSQHWPAPQMAFHNARREWLMGGSRSVAAHTHWTIRPSTPRVSCMCPSRCIPEMATGHFSIGVAVTM